MKRALPASQAMASMRSGRACGVLAQQGLRSNDELREIARAIVAKFKAKAAVVTTPDEMWAVQQFLAKNQRGIEQKYDYRYSQLILVSLPGWFAKVASPRSNSTGYLKKSSRTFGTSARCESLKRAIQFAAAAGL